MQKGHYDSAPLKPDGKKDFGVVKANGTGPYRITENKPGEHILMERFDDHFKDSFKGRPPIGEGQIPHDQGQQHPSAELMTGAIDFMWEMPKDVAERMAQAPSIKVESAKTLRIGYLQFDVNGRSGQK